MVIQHNMNSLNSLNRLSEATGKVKKASEKLASGYRINRAADDAAGLAISEKLRSQIRGLSQAVRNAQDGINYIQTGEGALEEIHSILRRGKELAAEAANGTYDNSTDRAALELEWKQLCSEVDHISETDFNGHQIFDIGDDVQRENPFGNDSKSALVMIKCTDGEFIPVSVTNKTLADTINSVVNTTGKGFTYQALENFSNEIKTTYLPQVLDRIVKALPNSSKPTVSGMTIGYELYEAKDNVLASVSSNGIDFKLKINVHHLEMNGGQINMTDDLAQTITHEMVHAVMDDVVSNGMLGMNPTTGKQNLDGPDRFPHWFIEGMAEAIAGTMQRYQDILPIKNESGKDGSTIGFGGFTFNAAKNQWEHNDLDNKIKTFAGGINNTTDSQTWYKQGSAAVMYLGHLAGNDGNANAVINGEKMAKGLDTVLSEIADGKSLDRVIDEYTSFDGTADFIANFAKGGDDIVDFMKRFIDASNAGLSYTGSNSASFDITKSGAGALGTPTKLSGTAGSLLNNSNKHDYFTLDFNNEWGDNSGIMNGHTIYEGGSAVNDGKDRDGNPPSASRPDKPDKPGGDKPDTPGGDKPDKPGGSTGGLEPTAITLQTGARTKDIVKFALTYDCDAVGDLKCDFNCSAKGLGISALTFANQKDANDAVDKIDFSINKISMMRTVFGAAQNRLGHKTVNLQVTKENLTASESSIRDTDMASEMLGFTKFNILQQAAQSMMVQSNQLPQGVLQLLQ